MAFTIRRGADVRLPGVIRVQREALDGALDLKMAVPTMFGAVKVETISVR